MRFDGGTQEDIPRSIGTFLSVEHYKRKDSFKCQFADRLLAKVFADAWKLKTKGRNTPYIIRAKRFYDRALLIQDEPDRLAAFCAVHTADTNSQLNFSTAIRAFPATPTVPPTVTPTTDPPPPLAAPIDFEDEPMVPCDLFPAPVQEFTRTWAEVASITPAAVTTARRRRVAGQSATAPTKVKRSKTRVHQRSLAIARESTKKALAGEIAAKKDKAAAEAKAAAAVAAAATDNKKYVLLDSTACCAYI